MSGVTTTSVKLQSIVLNTPKSSSSEWPDAEHYLARVVFEETEEASETGLYDKHGNKLYRTVKPKRIGFVIWDGNDGQ